MNSRIEELAQHCWVAANDTTAPKTPAGQCFDYRRFAEILVRECGFFADADARKSLYKNFGIKPDRIVQPPQIRKMKK